MQPPTKIALGIVAALVVLAIIVLSRGPGIVMPPTDSTTPTPVSATNMPTSSALPVYNVSLPAFQGITRWWNTPDNQPLTPERLRGKVVLVDFWTYSCINCIRTYPFLRSMHEKYADNGLVIVGVHTPEFEFEKNPENVGREIAKNGLRYPIALDPDYKTWNAYANHYWPAGYLFDAEGRLRRTHVGEGGYEETEEAIRSLLEENNIALGETTPTDMTMPDFSKIKTPETYFGLRRGDAFMGLAPKDTDVTLSLSGTLPRDRWTASGVWRFTDEYAEAKSENAIFRFKVQATKLHLVMESDDGTAKRIEVYVDGVKTGGMAVSTSELYDIATFTDGKEHTVEIHILDAGVRFYAATFS
jgi:thiol-disulfide isomerase/thioredoxin